MNELIDIQIITLHNSLPRELTNQWPPFPSPIQDILDKNLTEKELLDVYHKRITDYKLEATFRAATIKPIEFSDEQELRIVRFIKNKESNLHLLHRVKNGILIPYVEIGFDINSIKKIIIGPCTHKDLAEKGLRSLLKRLNLNNQIEIMHSTCSLRP